MGVQKIINVQLPCNFEWSLYEMIHHFLHKRPIFQSMACKYASQRIYASSCAKLALEIMCMLHVTRMSFDVFWLMRDCLAFSYTWSARIRLRECAEIDLLSFSRLLDTLRRSEEYQRCRPTFAVPLVICQLTNLLQHSNDLQAATRTPLQAMLKISKRPQGLLGRQCWRSPSGHKDSSASNSEDLQAPTRTPERAIILKINSPLNNQ